MSLIHFLLFSILGQLLHLCDAQQSQILLPRPNGTYTVGLSITELTDEALLEPFAPDAEPRVIGVSVFYPSTSSSTTPVQYMPAEAARFEDIYQSTSFDLPSPNGTFESLALQLANSGAVISATADGREWPVLIFAPAQGTTRHFYNAIASQVSSYGYVVISFDSPYIVDVFEYLNGSIALANVTVQPNEANAILGANAYAQDASFILDKFSNTTYTGDLIPGCKSCLNVSHVGMFGHSLGGAASATVMLNESRVAGGLDFDGALFGDVVEKGLDRPFMLMTAAGQTRASVNQPDNPFSSWFDIWPKLTGPKFDVIIANSLHYTYSDLPIALETLNIQPNSTSLKLEQITNLNGARALHIVTSYTTAFFDFVLRGVPPTLLEGPSPLFPEITFDDTKQGSGSVPTATTSTQSSSSATSSGKATSGAGTSAGAACDIRALLLVAGTALLLNRWTV